MRKGFYFILEPYVYTSIQGNDVLLFNLLNNSQIKCLNSIGIARLVKEIISIENLSVIQINETDLEDSKVKEFINDAKSKFMGDILEIDWSEKRPVQFTPILRFQVDKEETPENILGENILTYLTEITIFINDACELSCKRCGSAYKQFTHCTSSNNNNNNIELQFETLESLFCEIPTTSLTGINICGGNILLHSNFDAITKFLNNQNKVISYYIYYENIFSNIGKVIDLMSGELSELKILIHPVFNEAILFAIYNKLEYYIKNTEFIFIIESESDLECVDNFVKRLNIQNSVIIPYFSKSNLTFFEDNVFIKEEDIDNSKQDIKEIFSKKVINRMNFGKLIVKNDNGVYSNVNTPKLFDLGKKSIREGIFYELQHGKNWRNIRSNIEPCKKCLYVFLCPSVSNYEYVLKRNNLCHIWKEN